MHAEFSSQLINYAVLTLATVSFSLCKHEAAQNGKRVGGTGCQAAAETREQLFECWMVFTLALRVGGGGSPNTCLQQSGLFDYEYLCRWGWLCARSTWLNKRCDSNNPEKGASSQNQSKECSLCLRFYRRFICEGYNMISRVL